MEYTIQRIATFTGSAEQRQANQATHNFQTTFFDEDDCETRCFGCDCRPSSASADYPCDQTELPMELVHYRADGTTKVEAIGSQPAVANVVVYA